LQTDFEYDVEMSFHGINLIILSVVLNRGVDPTTSSVFLSVTHLGRV